MFEKIERVPGDAILGLIEFIRPDKLIIRYLVAPRAKTQAEMNEICARCLRAEACRSADCACM